MIFITSSGFWNLTSFSLFSPDEYLNQFRYLDKSQKSFLLFLAKKIDKDPTAPPSKTAAELLREEKAQKQSSKGEKISRKGQEDDSKSVTAKKNSGEKQHRKTTSGSSDSKSSQITKSQKSSVDFTNSPSLTRGFEVSGDVELDFDDFSNMAPLCAKITPADLAKVGRMWHHIVS